MADIVIDSENLEEAGFDSYLKRSMGLGVSRDRLVKADNFAGGLFGGDVIEVGGSNVRIDGERGRIIVKSGDGSSIAMGKLDDGTFGINLEGVAGSGTLSLTVEGLLYNDGTTNRVVIGDRS